MREVLGIHCCPHEGCPKIGKSGDVCPKHNLRMWRFIYRRVDNGTAPSNPGLDVLDSLLNIAEKFFKK